jgi:transcriptional regulator with XRE-family HTH domain
MTAEELQSWRTWQGWSQEDLADFLGTHPMTVSKWERGLHEVPPMVAVILKTTPVDPDQDVFEYIRTVLGRPKGLRVDELMRHGAGAGPGSFLRIVIPGSPARLIPRSLDWKERIKVLAAQLRTQQ